MTVDEPRGASVLKPAKTARTVAQTTPATVGQELRALIRAILLHAVRWESPHIARGQHRWRTPVLDLVFAKGMTLLGTHTFFLAGLPLLFWFGDVAFARHMTLQLAVGVMCTNAVKDLFCLPRPTAPPVVRLLHEQGSYHAFEYGLPSTHAANAASICWFLALYWGSSLFAQCSTATIALAVTLWAGYSVFLPLSRVYCGMHSVSDVVAGFTVGTAVTLADWTLIYDPLEHWLASGDFTGTLPVALLSASILFLVLVHPNPLGPCPCFDDSVCFGGVIVGLTAGGMRTRGLDPNAGSNVGMSLGEAALRLVLGVFVLFLWRYAAKRALLTVLTPVWLRHGMPLVYHQIGLKTVEDNTMADLHGKDKPVDIVLSDAFESTMDTQSVSVSEQQLIRRHRNSCSKISGSTNADEEEVDALAMQLSDTYRECLEDICTSTYCIPRHSLDVVVKLIVYSGIAWLGTDLIPSAFALIFV